MKIGYFLKNDLLAGVDWREVLGLEVLSTWSFLLHLH